MYKANDINIKSNLVLIKPDEDHEQSRDGIFIEGVAENKKAGIQNTKARHYSITGTVIQVPKKLLYRGKQQREIVKQTEGYYDDFTIRDLADAVRGSMEYETEMELLAGDKIWFDYGCHYTAFTEKKILNIEGYGLCYLIDYSAIFLRERLGIKTPVNGWIWIKNIQSERKLKSGLLLDETVNVTVQDIGEIVELGKPIKQYLSLLYEDIQDDLPIGTRFIYKHAMATPLEYVLHETEGIEGLLKIKRKDIIALI